MAASIVPVFKSDESIRICCDYKQTVNKVTSSEKYPVPKTEDIFATIKVGGKGVGGGGCFAKLDLSQAYQQLVLNPESKNLLTVNTHKELFRPTRLQFALQITDYTQHLEFSKGT